MKRLLLLLAVVMASTVLIPGPAAAGTTYADRDVTVQPGTGFTDEQVAEIRSLVAEATVPTRVLILARLPKSAAGSPRVLAEELERGRESDGPRATVVFHPDSIPEYGVFEWGDEPNFGAALTALREIPGTPQEKFVELVRMGTTGTGAQRLDEQLAERISAGGGQFREDTPSTKRTVLRWIAGLALLTLLVVFLALRARAIRGWWQRHRRTRGLEEAVHGAEAQGLADRAKADVMEFGAAIDAEGMDEHDVLDLWQLALNDYDEASRLLDRAEGPRDHRKVIEVCDRGMDRLRKAQR